MKISIVNGTIVTGDGKTVLPESSVVVEDVFITRIHDTKYIPYNDSDRIIDAQGGFILPGLINHHSHEVAFGPNYHANSDSGPTFFGEHRWPIARIFGYLDKPSSGWRDNAALAGRVDERVGSRGDEQDSSPQRKSRDDTQRTEYGKHPPARRVYRRPPRKPDRGADDFRGGGRCWRDGGAFEPVLPVRVLSRGWPTDSDRPGEEAFQRAVRASRGATPEAV